MTMTQSEVVRGQNEDFLPLKGIDYVEFYVGNARQAAHYYRMAFGFKPIAYSGLETGVRDRTSYVMEQRNIRMVLTGALDPDSPIAEHVKLHGTASKTSPLPSKMPPRPLKKRSSAARSQCWSQR
jgi:4-hydroxyphenylpyruvate dioxygenase